MFSRLCSSVYDLSKDGALWEHCSGTYGRWQRRGGSGEGGRIMTEDIERAVRHLPKAMSRMRLVIVPGTQFVDTVTTGTDSYPSDIVAIRVTKGIVGTENDAAHVSYRNAHVTIGTHTSVDRVTRNRLLGSRQ